MARLLVEEGAYDAAWPLLEEAEQVYTREGAETYPGYATILSIQAGLLRDQANFTDARRLYERAPKSRRRHGGFATATSPSA